MSSSPGRLHVRAELAALKRDRIISVASELFARGGYDNTRLDAVADQLGVTKQFIYSEFSSKADLLAEICMRAVTSTLAETDEIVDHQGSATERLAMFVRLFVTGVCTHQTDVAVFAHEQKNLVAADKLRLAAVRRRLDKRVLGLLEDGIASGEFAIGELRIAALTIQGMISWMYVWYRPEGSLSIEALADEVVVQVLRLVGAVPR